jgi:ferredoxin-like protein FixX
MKNKHQNMRVSPAHLYTREEQDISLSHASCTIMAVCMLRSHIKLLYIYISTCGMHADDGSRSIVVRSTIAVLLVPPA